jgi:uracil-DNA glycosylase
MSANQGKWFGNKHFSQATLYLKKNNLEPIHWI